MSLDWERLGSEGIRFFGRLGVASARDMARILDDIARQASLVAEQADLAERGVAPDPGRLSVLAARLEADVERAGALLEGVRLAAATAEAPVGLINVPEVAERMVRLFRPRAERERIGLVLKGGGQPAYAASNAFFLQNYLHLAVEQALDGVLEGQGQGPVEVIVRREEDGASVEVVAPGRAMRDPGLREKLALLAHSLEAEMTLDGHRLLLKLPNRGRLIETLRRERD